MDTASLITSFSQLQVAVIDDFLKEALSHRYKNKKERNLKEIRNNIKSIIVGVYNSEVNGTVVSRNKPKKNSADKPLLSIKEREAERGPITTRELKHFPGYYVDEDVKNPKGTRAFKCVKDSIGNLVALAKNFPEDPDYIALPEDLKIYIPSDIVRSYKHKNHKTFMDLVEKKKNKSHGKALVEDDYEEEEKKPPKKVAKAPKKKKESESEESSEEESEEEESSQSEEESEEEASEEDSD